MGVARFVKNREKVSQFFLAVKVAKGQMSAMNPLNSFLTSRFEMGHFAQDVPVHRVTSNYARPEL